MAGLRLLDVQQVTGLAASRLSMIERGEAPLRRRELRRLAELYEVAEPESLVDASVRVR